jgi:hypothetical protein
MVESTNVVSFDEEFFHDLITATTEESKVFVVQVSKNDFAHSSKAKQEFIEHSREEKGFLG